MFTIKWRKLNAALLFKMWSKNITFSNQSDKCDSTFPATKVFHALKLTPKGRLKYDRDPTSPPPLIHKLDITKEEDHHSSSAVCKKATTTVLERHDNGTVDKTTIPTKNDYREDPEKNDKMIPKDSITTECDISIYSITPKYDITGQVSPIPLQKQKLTPFDKERKESLITTDDNTSFEDTTKDDEELCKRLRKMWSVNDKDALVVLERVSLLKMENMRRKGEQVDNALMAMEIKREAHVRKILAKKEEEIGRKTTELKNEVREVFLKNMEQYHQREKALQEEEERKTFELQRKLDEYRERQQEENRLSKQQRYNRLQQELKIVAEQQLLQRKKQEEEARLHQEAESKRIAAEEKLNNMEERRRIVISSAAQAYSLYDEVRPGRDDILTKEEGEQFLVDTLSVPLESVNTSILADAITRLTAANDVMVMEDEANRLENISSFFINAADALTRVRNTVIEKKQFEKDLHDKKPQHEPIESLPATSVTQSKEIQQESLSTLQKNTTDAAQISQSNLDRHSSIQAFRMSFAEKIKDLEKDKGSQIKFAIQKRVNIPVNAIAATSSEHMKDKLVKLRQLLSGDLNVQGINDVQIARDYAKNLLAAKFVKQGEIEVSNKRVADDGFQGFAYAAIITGTFKRISDYQN